MVLRVAGKAFFICFLALLMCVAGVVLQAPIFVARSEPQPMQPILSVTAFTTNSSGYTRPPFHYRQLVSLHGNVSYEGELVPSGLVAIQFESPTDGLLAVRTVPANTTPTLTWPVDITSFYMSDGTGTPSDIFNRNKNAWFQAHIENNDPLHTRTVLFVLTLFDSDSTPFATRWATWTLNPGAEWNIFQSIYIDLSASYGNATACAGIYTDWPKNGGYPYSPGKTVSFGIENLDGSPSQPVDIGYASFRAAFRIPPDAEDETHNFYITAWYIGEYTAITQATFNKEYDMLGDVRFDRSIDIFDIVIMSSAYGSRGGQQKWNPIADIAPEPGPPEYGPNGKVNIFDIVTVTYLYGQTY